MDDISMEDWFLQYGQYVHNYLVYFTGNRDVSDLVQETFLRALKGIRTYNPSCSPLTWLIAIARNVAIDEQRRLKRSRISYAELIGDNIPGTGLSPESVAELLETRRELLAVIDRMKQTYRDVVVMRLFLDLSIADCARILGWSESKVKVTQQRALKQLRSDYAIHVGAILHAQ